MTGGALGSKKRGALQDVGDRKVWKTGLMSGVMDKENQVNRILSPTKKPRKLAAKTIASVAAPVAKPEQIPVQRRRLYSREFLMQLSATGKYLPLGDYPEEIISTTYAPPPLPSELLLVSPELLAQPLAMMGLNDDEVAELLAAPAPTPATQETEEARLVSRQKQIDYGKCTEGYANYLRAVPREQRLPNHPRTPNPRQNCSKRSWDGQVRKWRRELHAWDSKPLTETELATAISI